MELTTNLSLCKKFRMYQFLTTTILGKLTLSILFATITGISANFKFYLPWSPVPITGQTFAVLLSGVMLGARWGGISQLLYICLGISGINWFATGNINLLSFWGPSFGYLIGFIFASIFTGYIFENFKNKLDTKKTFATLAIINFTIIYIPGLIVLNFWNTVIKGVSISFINLIALGVLPFIFGDLFKLLLLTGVIAIFNNKIKYILK